MFKKGHKIWLGRKHSLATKEKISLVNKGQIPWIVGKHHSEETKRKLSLANKGKKHPSVSGVNHPNYGKPGTMYGKKHTLEARKKMSAWQIGKKHLEETKRKIGIKSRGRIFSIESRKKMSIKRIGSGNGNWRGGITKITQKIRNGIEYQVWHSAVLARDWYTCQKYGIRGCRLVAHHILNFSQHPELRFAIDNGITLSVKAHREFHRKYGYTNNTKEQLNQFLCI